MEKFPNFMKNSTVKIGPKHEKIPKYGIFIVEKFLTIVEYFLIFHKIFTPAPGCRFTCNESLFSSTYRAGEAAAAMRPMSMQIQYCTYVFLCIVKVITV